MLNKIKPDFNYHSHTYRCGHAAKTALDKDYVDAAIKAGFKFMAFTDHVPLSKKYDFEDNMRMSMSSINEYIESINKIKRDYKDKIDVRVGFEFEYVPDDNEVAHLLELKKRTDIMIQGQHFVIDKDGDFVGINMHTIKKPIDEDLDTYLSYICLSIDRKIPDIIAHPDIFMYRRSFFGEKEEQISRLLCKKVIEAGIPLEINLGRIGANYIMKLNGKKYSQQIKYPCKEFWKIVAEESEYSIKNGEMPIKVLFGKDCHDPRQYELEDDYRYAIEIIGKDIVDRLFFVDKDFNFIKSFKKFDLNRISDLSLSYGINVYRKEAYDILSKIVFGDNDDIKLSYRNVASEIVEVFNNADSKVMEKIPDVLLKYFSKIKNSDYIFNIDNGLSNVTIGLLSLIYQNYILDDVDKELYISKLEKMPKLFEVEDECDVVVSKNDIDHLNEEELSQETKKFDNFENFRSEKIKRLSDIEFTEEDKKFMKESNRIQEEAENKLAVIDEGNIFKRFINKIKSFFFKDVA